MQKTFQVQKDFICKIPLLEEFQIQLSRKLKDYLPLICQNVQKAPSRHVGTKDYQGAEGKKYSFKFLNEFGIGLN